MAYDYTSMAVELETRVIESRQTAYVTAIVRQGAVTGIYLWEFAFSDNGNNTTKVVARTRETAFGDDEGRLEELLAVIRNCAVSA